LRISKKSLIADAFKAGIERLTMENTMSVSSKALTRISNCNMEKVFPDRVPPWLTTILVVAL